MSGSETPYDDTNVRYASRKGRGNNNCYAYALDLSTTRGAHKLQPGDLSPGNRGEVDLRDCSDLRRRVLRDGAAAASPDGMCPSGTYKIMGFVAPGQDFHWYKQNGDLRVRADQDTSPTSLARRLGVPRDAVNATPGRKVARGEEVSVRHAGLWSHKRGFATGPLLLDACGKPIVDPRRACRDYSSEGGANYSKFCGAYCVRRRRQFNKSSRRASRGSRGSPGATVATLSSSSRR